METYNDIYIRVRRALKGAGVENTEMEAKYIVASAMGKTREQLLAMNTVYATDVKIKEKIEQSVERRLKHEPLAYILGEWEFYGLTITINNNVLIPRTDTETLAAEAIKLIKKKVWKARILDLCAGSGCIGLAIAKNIPSCHVVMADVNEEALALCRQNALRCGLSRNTTVVEADALKPPPALFGAFDVIVCNPPYIPTADIELLDSSVRDYEPLQALDGGPDGLKFFKEVTGKWTSILKPGGNLAFECGIDQAEDVSRLMVQNKFTDITIIKDTQAIERVITGKYIS